VLELDNDLKMVNHEEMEADTIKSGFLYCAKSFDSTVMKLGMTNSTDPAQYVQRRYAFVLDIECLVGVVDALMAERIAFHLLDAYHIQHEIFRACDWKIVQRAFEKAAVVVSRADICVPYCEQNGIEQLRPPKQRVRPREHFDD
jgi:hypothetical protein